jgi:uncharacterized protein (DUF2235 family)
VKRIIVCLDGTWNSAKIGGPTTNVVTIRDNLVATLKTGENQQRIYYDEGVGTGDPLDKLPGGGLGVGLSDNVRQAYKYISRHFVPGDEIYLIGFSRGAFTARSVAGYIATCGLLTDDNCTTKREAAAWHYYRTLRKDRPSGDEIDHRRFCHPEDTKIKCVAVFDTVGALGIPGKLNWIARKKFAFHDTQLNLSVENCFHAVSIDEKRMTFVATMWERPFNFERELPEVQQVWFPGVHGDIGGGYEERDLSDAALDWMTLKLQSLEVQFANPPRPLRKPSPTGKMHESRTLPLYAFSRDWPHHRPISAVKANGSQRGNDIVQYRPIGEFVHRSALERWQACDKYRPINLNAVLPQIAGGKLHVIDWDGSVMPQPAVQAAFGSVLPPSPANPAPQTASSSPSPLSKARSR